MGQVIKFDKLKNCRLTQRPKKVKGKNTDVPSHFNLVVSWVELDHQQNEWNRSITFDRHDPYTALTPFGRELLAEYCLNIIGILAYTDLNLAAKIKDKVLESLQDE